MRFPAKRTLAAVIALTAWVNVQAMTCCGILTSGGSAHASHAIASSMSASVAAPSASEGHSCCPRSSERSSEDASEKMADESRDSRASHNDGCGMNHSASPSASGHASLCCGGHEPALGSASLDFVVFEARIPVAMAALLAPDLDASHTLELSFSASSAGPPRYLSLQRILI